MVKGKLVKGRNAAKTIACSALVNLLDLTHKVGQYSVVGKRCSFSASWPIR